MNDKRSVYSWALYDWANSAFATTVMAGFFPLFFKGYWANPDNPQESTFYLGMANSIASITVAALAPFLGAVADKMSAKKKFLMFFLFIGVIMTGSLWLVHRGDWMLAALFYVLAMTGFAGGNIFYDSLLMTVAPADRLDFVSSLGYALGYIGGGLLFLVNVIMYLKPHIFGIPDGSTAIRLSFVSVAVWWGVFSLPILIFVREPVIPGSPGLGESMKQGWQQLADTVKSLKNYKVVGTFLLAYWLYIDGVDTIIVMAVDYGMSIGFSSSSLITALLMVQFIAFPSALGYSKIASRIGTRNAIFTGICAYSIITIFSYFMKSEIHFYILAAAVGLFQGGIQALSRSLYARIIPVSKSAQFYGFYNMLGKFASVLGPMMVGSVTMVTGNVRYGILSVILLFIAGGFLLMKTDIGEGERIAREEMDG